MTTESIARAPEAALDLITTALANVDALLDLVEQRAPSPETALAALAALELRGALAAVQLSAELLAAYGRRRYRAGWRACEQTAAGDADAPRLRLVSAG
jgi:hypothetical protein